MTKLKPRFGAGIISDGAREQASGKIDAHGIFTRFLAWGYPATRAWSLIFTIYDLPFKRVTFIISIKRKGSSEVNTITTVDFTAGKTQNEHTFNIELGYRFEKEGDYEIICSLKDYETLLKIPMRVTSREWPVITEKEIEILRQNRNNILNRLSIQVKCKSCNQIYIFEEIIIPEDEVTNGAIKIPENGEFECENCGHIMKLKDLKGQIRASIKDSLLNFAKSNSHV